MIKNIRTDKRQNVLGSKYRGFTIGIIVLVVVIVLIASYSIMYIMERRTHTAAEKLVSSVVMHIDEKMNEVKNVTRAAAHLAYGKINDPDALEQLVREFVSQNAFVYGSTIAFEPNAFPGKGRCFAPYSWVSSDGVIQSRQLGTETDYYQEEWYLETKQKGQEYWCEPYFDEGGAKIMMCTFSVPVMDDGGKLAAVMTSDVGLADLEEYVSSIRPSDDSYIVLHSRSGNVLANEKKDSSSRNGTVIIKGMTEIGWSVELVVPFNYLMHGNTGIFYLVGIILLITVLFVILINRLLSGLQQRATVEYLNVIDAISRSYSSIYLLDLVTGETVVFRDPEDYIHILDELNYGKANFTSRISGLLEYDCFSADREMMFREVSAKTICEKLVSQDRYQVRFRKGLDELCWYEMDVFLLERDSNGVPIRAVVAFTNVNEHVQKEKDAQDVLGRALMAAESASKAKTNFLFNMSHDIRTPMNAIHGFTAMAKKNAGDEKKVIEYLDKIDRSSQQLLTLINQVLEMARIESGKAVFDEKPINVREEFNAIVTILSEQAKAKGLDFRFSLSNIEHNRILADEAKMSSITLNIAGNAIKYTPEGGCIEFALKEIPHRKPKYASFVLSVVDTGIGMSKEYLNDLYEPFTREKSSTVSKIQGTGLGMSIVKSLVDLMEGNISVQSDLGKGTKFDITLDFKIDENAAEEEENEEDTVVDFKGRRVLLVEDNEMNREIAKDILEEHGLVVEDADDGDVAVEKVKSKSGKGESEQYDFILMDIQMPRMNGYEATRAIRALEVQSSKSRVQSGSNIQTSEHADSKTSTPNPQPMPRIPIIAMTANAFEEDRQNALAAGMDEHLSKPIDVRKMFRIIAKILVRDGEARRL